MTTNVLPVVSDAVKTALESITLSQRFVLYRSYGDWEDMLEETERDLRIDVIPQECQSELMNRGSTEYRVRISIYLRKRLTASDRIAGKINPTVIDQLVGDLQAVHEYFVPSQPTQNGLRLSAVQQARWLEGSIKAPFSRKMLKLGQYSGWCDVIFGYAKTAGS